MALDQNGCSLDDDAKLREWFSSKQKSKYESRESGSRPFTIF